MAYPIVIQSMNNTTTAALEKHVHISGKYLIY